MNSDNWKECERNVQLYKELNGKHIDVECGRNKSNSSFSITWDQAPQWGKKAKNRVAMHRETVDNAFQLPRLCDTTFAHPWGGGGGEGGDSDKVVFMLEDKVKLLLEK